MLDFTQGKWKYEESVTINGKEYIIYMGSVNPKEPGENIALARRKADARLIAAAPELYEALKACADFIEDIICWKCPNCSIDAEDMHEALEELFARIDGKEALS